MASYSHQWPTFLRAKTLVQRGFSPGVMSNGRLLYLDQASSAFGSLFQAPEGPIYSAMADFFSGENARPTRVFARSGEQWPTFRASRNPDLVVTLRDGGLEALSIGRSQRVGNEAGIGSKQHPTIAVPQHSRDASRCLSYS